MTIPRDSAALGPSLIQRPSTGQLWRPVLVMMGVAIVMKFVMFVEDHPQAAGQGFGRVPKAELDNMDNTTGILDSGFVITRFAHTILRAHPLWNDVAAILNSLLVCAVVVRVAYVGLWRGDYGLVFRIVFTQLLRGISGWVTYLPPSKDFLPSKVRTRVWGCRGAGDKGTGGRGQRTRWRRRQGDRG